MLIKKSSFTNVNELFFIDIDIKLLYTTHISIVPEGKYDV